MSGGLYGRTGEIYFLQGKASVWSVYTCTDTHILSLSFSGKEPGLVYWIKNIKHFISNMIGIQRDIVSSQSVSNIFKLLSLLFMRYQFIWWIFVGNCIKRLTDISQAIA